MSRDANSEESIANRLMSVGRLLRPFFGSFISFGMVLVGSKTELEASRGAIRSSWRPPLVRSLSNNWNVLAVVRFLIPSFQTAKVKCILMKTLSVISKYIWSTINVASTHLIRCRTFNVPFPYLTRTLNTCYNVPFNVPLNVPST